MTFKKVKKLILSYKWEYWIDRPLKAFMVSQFKNGGSKYMKKIDPQLVWPAFIFQNGAWYKSTEIWEKFERVLGKCIKKDSNLIFKISKSCEKYGKKSEKEIKKIVKSKLDSKAKLKKFYEIIEENIAYIWLAHGFDFLYEKKLRQELKKYHVGDIDKYIGDVCFPKKLNEHSKMEKDIKKGVPIEGILKKYAWIKARDGFSQGFTYDEIKKLKEKLQKDKKNPNKRPEIPKELKQLVLCTQELVYLRTLRTDVWYKLNYVARPIFQEVAKDYGIKFEDLKYCSIQDLIAGKLVLYSGDFCCVGWKGDFFIDSSTIINEKYVDACELKGVIAYSGKVKGVAKIVKSAQEVGKVKKGDILISPTTAPSFIVGMRNAAAFVTDEGGITSHTAIVAREMKKPCIIATKTATKVFKDGDMVEVDAQKGVVRILKK